MAPRTLAEALLGAVGDTAQQYGANLIPYRMKLADMLRRQETDQATADYRNRQASWQEEQRQWQQENRARALSNSERTLDQQDIQNELDARRLDAANRDKYPSSPEAGLTKLYMTGQQGSPLAKNLLALAADLAGVKRAPAGESKPLTRPQVTALMNKNFAGQAAAARGGYSPSDIATLASGSNPDPVALAAKRKIDYIYSPQHRSAFFNPESLLYYNPETFGQIEATPSSFWNQRTTTPAARLGPPQSYGVSGDSLRTPAMSIGTSIYPPPPADWPLSQQEWEDYQTMKRAK